MSWSGVVVISSPSAPLIGGIITRLKTRSVMKGAQRGVKVSEQGRLVSSLLLTGPAAASRGF